MQNKHFLFAKTYGNSILFRGYEDGQSITRKVPFQPTLFVKSQDKKDTGWKSFYKSESLDAIQFGDIREAKDFMKKYDDVSNFEIHGQTKWEYQFLNEEYKGDIQYDMRNIKTLVWDLECISEHGFPDIELASDPITLISMYEVWTNKLTVLGLKPYNRQPHHDVNFEYKQFSSEEELLKYFIAYHMSVKPDVWTGWNTSMFDIPYLCNRIARLFSEDMVKKLSPFGVVREREIPWKGKIVKSYDVYGIIDLDYLELFKKFTYGGQESYELGYIAQEELGETKVEMKGSSFKDNYDNFFDDFVFYSGTDSLLVYKLDNKMKLIDLIFSMAYLMKCNLQDVYKTVAPWECFIFNFLVDKKIAIPIKTGFKDSETFVGGWVKEPSPGLYGWTLSFDLNSLYPSIIRQWNISPETMLPIGFDHEGSYKAFNDVCFKSNVVGMLPEILTNLGTGRTVAKNKMLELESLYQQTKDESLISQIATLNARQMALKISQNSVYGALGNSGFRYYNWQLAEAVTMTGQVIIKGIAAALDDKLNSISKLEYKEMAIYQDTDSVYLDMQPIVAKYCQGKTDDKIVKFLDDMANKVLQPVIDNAIQGILTKAGCTNKTVIKMKREAIASKTLFRAAKNYAMYVHNSEGVSYNPPKIKVQGLEVVRSSTPAWCRSKLKDGIKYIFTADKEYMTDYYAKCHEEFLSLSPEQISFPRGVSDVGKWKNGDGYRSGCPIHVRASLLYNRYTKDLNLEPISDGDKIRFVYLKTPNPIRENVIAIPSSGKLPVELGLHKYVDYETQFTKTFADPMKSLTDVAGWKIDGSSSLEDFFG